MRPDDVNVAFTTFHCVKATLRAEVGARLQRAHTQPNAYPQRSQEPPTSRRRVCEPPQMTWRTTTEELRFLQQSMPDGVAALRQLESLGVDSSTAYRRCRPGGPWQRLLPGVLVLHAGRPSQRQRLRAALVHCGDGSMLTGTSAVKATFTRVCRVKATFTTAQTRTQAMDRAMPSRMSCSLTTSSVIPARAASS